jgi:hypothetical protein
VISYQEALDYIRNARFTEGELIRLNAGRESRNEYAIGEGCCQMCGFPLRDGGGWLTVNVLPEHPLFGALVKCPACHNT